MASPNAFGAGTNGGTSSPSFFGQNNNATNTTAGGSTGLFGNTPTQGASTPTAFGGGSAKLGFGSNTAATSGFGSLGQNSTANPFGGGSAPSGPSFFSKAADENNASPATASFNKTSPDESQAAAASPSIFGAKDGASTPTSTKTGFSFGAASTTPAGPPPSGAQNARFNIGGPLSKTSSPLFDAGMTSNSGGSALTTTAKHVFGSAAASPAGTPLFGAAISSPTNLFGDAKAVQATTAASEPATKDTAATGQGSDQASTAKPSLFAAATQQTSSPFSLGGTGTTKPGSDTGSKPSPFSFPSPTKTTTAPEANKPVFSFPATASAAPQASPTTATPATKTASVFGTANKSVAPPANMFGSFAPKKDSPLATPATSTASTAAAPADTTGPAPGPSSDANTTTPAAQPASSTAGVATSSSTAPAAGASALGSSTSGPAPSAQSRLKNKSMDEIITRWASDLSKYQKEFQSQAERVSSWDRMLVENGNAIAKLYSRTFQAERDTAELQRQLSAVEGHQDELSQWLDRYEREVDDMLARQVGQHDSMQGPDQERERTYKIAEKVSERLNEMGQNLTGMIDEINVTSSAIQKTSKPDDPLSQIVRILNGHLSHLQAIDQGTTALQSKVVTAQKESQRLGYRGHRGPTNDAVDDFYRSYSRRT